MREEREGRKKERKKERRGMEGKKERKSGERGRNEKKKRHTLSIGHNVLLHLCDLMSRLRQQTNHIHRHLLINPRPSLNRILHNMIPTNPIAEHHIKRRSRRPLLLITLNRHTIQPGPSKQQPLDLIRISMVIKMHRPIRRKQAIELLVCHAVRMECLRFENHEVRDVYDAHTQGGTCAPEDRGCADDFKGELGADADEDDVRV